ncbi:hypothetical protein BDR03DRAFT_117087 [Suillus americanus]|nr:hypothetical protein BDR03DRAFT_117087 [Suillus americanus]
MQPTRASKFMLINMLVNCTLSARRLACSRPQVTDGNIIRAETCMEINDSEKTTLIRKNCVFQFSVDLVFVYFCSDSSRITRRILCRESLVTWKPGTILGPFKISHSVCVVTTICFLASV